jgi:hypothetical protein
MRAVGNRTLPRPAPLPPERERGADVRVRAVGSRAYALGYDIAPLPGLGRDRPLGEHFVSELLVKSNREASHIGSHMQFLHLAAQHQGHAYDRTYPQFP